jgi:hypothetical protein
MWPVLFYLYFLVLFNPCSLKYIKQQDAEQLETVKAEGLTQIRNYLRHEKLRVLSDLRVWLVIFVGPKAQVVLAVETGR